MNSHHMNIRSMPITYEYSSNNNNNNLNTYQMNCVEYVDGIAIEIGFLLIISLV